MKHVKKETLFSLRTVLTVVVDDAIITLLHNIYSHIDTCKTYARSLLIDFSSAFNTIRPQVLLHKLQNLNVNPHLSLWINDFLFQRSQRVRVSGVSYDVTHLSTGVPQGCVLSPLLFSLFTSDFKVQNDSCILIKYADDTVLTGLIANNNELVYRNKIDLFVNWCG